MNTEKQLLLESDCGFEASDQTVAYPERPNNVSGGMFIE